MPATSSASRAATALVAALAAVFALSGPAAAGAVPRPDAPCPTGIGVGLVDQVGGADPRASSYVVDQVEGGDAFSRRMRVCNGTDQAVTVDLYAGAAEVQDGAFRVLEGRPASELTAWTRIEPGRMTIPAGKAAVATAHFQVPQRVEDGERYGALLVALPGRSSRGVEVVSRVGVRVYLAVGDAAARTDFTVRSLQAVRDDQGSPQLRALVRNTGRRAVDPRGVLSLTEGPGRSRVGPFPAQVGTTVAPGEEATVLVPLETELPDGPWKAELVLRAGGVERRVAATVTWPRSGLAEPVPAQELEGRGGTVLAAAGLVLLLGVVLLGLLLLARRRRAAPVVDAPVPAPLLAPLPIPVPSPVPAPLPVLPAPRNAGVRRALAQRAAGAGSALPAEAP